MLQKTDPHLKLQADRRHPPTHIQAGENFFQPVHPTFPLTMFTLLSRGMIKLQRRGGLGSGFLQNKTPSPSPKGLKIGQFFFVDLCSKIL
jgi:hypothetical protein